MDDLISRKAVLALPRNKTRNMRGWIVEETINVADIEQLPSAQPDNQINLCDSCDYSYPDCPSKNDDVIFGNGIGNDNICACNKYKPSAQPMRKEAKWMTAYLDHESMGCRPKILYCSRCNQCVAYPTNFCPACGADMRDTE